MNMIRRRSLAAPVLMVLLAACSQGAETTGVPSWPPPPGPGGGTVDDGPATFGIDSGNVPVDGCCVPHAEGGCNDQVVQSCICNQAPACCTSDWSDVCVSLVDDLGCGFCNGGPLDAGEDPDSGPPPPPPPEEQDCCIGHGEPGCNDDAVETCVCTEISFCCDSGWEEVCASAVEALGCGHCAGVGESGGPPPPPGDSGDSGGPPLGGDGDCCMDNGTPGCDDPAIESCVCMQDAYCCSSTWDSLCVDEVAMFGCGDCGGAMPPPPPGTSTCCSAQAGPGCDDQAIADCVCFIDDFCCTTQWDAVCAIFVELFLCGSCG
ncbi:hypothetical protein [Paraliomyxa miuraensis]|uniref:hypothetical protein n=1 Tax=Paraliomyxa miuraensis TaxID=376150 RepID=UPI00225560E2|nr:hypothetical protein [Paraliomyxa miuraensis]MCX4243567.1 hypothetical protein [Paraliomyxa miuraensis]